MTPAFTSAVILTVLFGLYFVTLGFRVRLFAYLDRIDVPLKIAASILLVATGTM